MSLTQTEIDKISKRINKFTRALYRDYQLGIHIIVVEENYVPKKNIITIDELEEIAQFISGIPNVMRDNSRKADKIEVRRAIYKIAVDIGHRPYHVSKKFERANATILNGYKEAQDLFETKNPKFMNIYNKLISESKQRQIIYADKLLQSDNPGPSKPKSVLRTMLNKKLS